MELLHRPIAKRYFRTTWLSLPRPDWVHEIKHDGG
jgi:hypothetical protein